VKVTDKIILQQANGVTIEIGRASLQHLSENICPHDFWVLRSWGQNTYDDETDLWVLVGSLPTPANGELLSTEGQSCPTGYIQNLKTGNCPLFLSFWERGAGKGKGWHRMAGELVITSPDSIAWMCGDAISGVELSL